MSKVDGLRKVQALHNVAADERAPDGERRSATQALVRLRLKYGISDDEMKAMTDQTEDVVMFGVSLFWYSNNIKPSIARMKEEIEVALDRIEKLPVRGQACELHRFYKDVKELVEGSPYAKKLKQKRDEAVKAFHAETVEQYPGEKDQWAFRHAVEHVASATDMRRDHVRRIVGG